MKDFVSANERINLSFKKKILQDAILGIVFMGLVVYSVYVIIGEVIYAN